MPDGYVAVLIQIRLETGDRAWVITYWTRDEIPPVRLHQSWLRQDHWFKDARRRSTWVMTNDTWDFTLEPYVADGRLRWIDPADPQQRVVRASATSPCPFLGIAGDHRPQELADGMRELNELPDGAPVYPFES